MLEIHPWRCRADCRGQYADILLRLASLVRVTAVLLVV
jgi:hypothetical protein